MRRQIGIVAVIAGLLVLPAGANAAAASGEVWTTTLSGAAEVPAVATSANGSATFVLSPDGTTIRYLVQYSGLSGPLAAAHIHLGAAGANGGVMFPLAAGPSPFAGTLDASDFVATGGVMTFSAAVDAIRAGGAYVNLHTAANPAGELRGQLAVATGAQGFSTPLTGSQEVPPLTGTATGEATVVINAGGDTITWWLAYSAMTSAPAAGHIHLGAVGSNGGILFPLAGVGTSPAAGTLTAASLTPTGGVTTFGAALEAIRAGSTYVNLHTAANPAGELRGQLGVTVAAPAPSSGPQATSSPAVTVPPTSTGAANPGLPGSPPLSTVALLAAAAGLGFLLAAAAARRSRT